MTTVTTVATDPPMARRLLAEAVGTFFLLATVVGSGIMAERLAGGNVAIALLGNTIPTGAILVVLITLFGPVSGAHFNPAVTLGFRLKGDIATGPALAYGAVQIAGGLIGVWAAHAMFETAILQAAATARTGPAQWFSEMLATFGLMLTILGTLRAPGRPVAWMVGLYITAAYWFTASTSFANPAVTIARAFTDSFSGILPAHAPAFVLAQCLGAGLAVALAAVLWPVSPEDRPAPRPGAADPTPSPAAARR